MNDTHGQQGEGWIGFDLDGTLAKYDGWRGIDHIGEPVGPMVALIKKMHAEGMRVKILTARFSPRAVAELRLNPYLENHWCIESPDDMPWALKGQWTALEFIQDWCWKHLGFVPEVTHEKDHLMLDLYDDRCHQVEPNTGVVIADRCAELEKKLEQKEAKVRVVRIVERVDLRWTSGLLYLCLGLAIGWLLFIGLQCWLNANAVPQREQKLHDALCEYLEASKAAAVIDAAKGACGWTR